MFRYPNAFDNLKLMIDYKSIWLSMFRYPYEPLLTIKGFIDQTQWVLFMWSTAGSPTGRTRMVMTHVQPLLVAKIAWRWRTVNPQQSSTRFLHWHDRLWVIFILMIDSCVSITLFGAAGRTTFDSWHVCYPIILAPMIFLCCNRTVIFNKMMTV